MDTSKAVFSCKDAAEYLAVSASFLALARIAPDRASGPNFVRIPNGRGIRYRRVDLDKWLADAVVEVAKS